MQMMNEIFGDLLYVPNGDNIETFPSPEELKMKILVSTKPPTEYLEDLKTPKTNEPQVQGGNEDEAWGADLPSQKLDDVADVNKVQSNIYSVLVFYYNINIVLLLSC
jgi:phosphatidylinositol phospholipase C, delta